MHFPGDSDFGFLLNVMTPASVHARTQAWAARQGGVMRFPEDTDHGFLPDVTRYKETLHFTGCGPNEDLKLNLSHVTSVHRAGKGCLQTLITARKHRLTCFVPARF